MELDMNYVKMELGERIRVARLIKKMSKEDLAKAVGVSKSSICRYESGISIPQGDILFKLMYILDINMVSKEEYDTKMMEKMMQEFIK